MIPNHMKMMQDIETSQRTYRLTRPGLEPTTGVQLYPGDVAHVLGEVIAGEAQEVVLIAAIDRAGYVIEVAEVGRGDEHRVSVELAPLLRVPLVANTPSAVIAHNHPSGELRPSVQDRALTKAVAVGLTKVGVILADHLIYAPDGQYVSLREVYGLEPPPAQPKTVQA